MNWAFLLVLFFGGAPETPQTTDATVEAIAASGRCASLPETPSHRVAPPPEIAPGAPPLLSFRYYEGAQRRRFGKIDVVLDDAGH